MKYLKLIPLLIILSGCANLVGNFDQNSYVAATVLKTKSLNLISNATETAGIHEAEILELQSELEAQVAYEQGKGKNNTTSYDQWKTLASPETDLLGKCLKEWLEGRVFSQAYVKEKSIQVGLAFDEIIKLEGAKPK